MIEDDPDFAKILGSFFKESDILITNIEDPYRALVANIKEFDLIILDLTLDGMDGIDVCLKIQQKLITPGFFLPYSPFSWSRIYPMPR